jgi:hypothetical protein
MADAQAQYKFVYATLVAVQKANGPAFKLCP